MSSSSNSSIKEDFILILGSNLNIINSYELEHNRLRKKRDQEFELYAGPRFQREKLTAANSFTYLSRELAEAYAKRRGYNFALKSVLPPGITNPEILNLVAEIDNQSPKLYISSGDVSSATKQLRKLYQELINNLNKEEGTALSNRTLFRHKAV